MESTVYIVILNWNGTEDTIECIESIKKLTYENYQIILVDNGSETTSLNKLKKWLDSNFSQVSCFGVGKNNEALNYKGEFQKKNHLILIQNNENLGFAGGNNIALNYILSKNKPNFYVLLLNNDTTVEPNSLEILFNFMQENPSYVACTPQIRYYSNKKLIWNCGGKITWFGNRKYYFAREDISKVSMANFVDITFITGCALFFNPYKTGILSDKFFFGEEDFEFSLRMKKLKYKMACVYNSIIYHKVGASINNNDINREINKTFLFYTSRLINLKSYNPTPLLQIKQFINIFYGFIMFNFRFKLGFIRSIFFFKDIHRFVKHNDKITKSDFNNFMNNRYIE